MTGSPTLPGDYARMKTTNEAGVGKDAQTGGGREANGVVGRETAGWKGEDWRTRHRGRPSGEQTNRTQRQFPSQARRYGYIPLKMRE